ncbi:hypothetical protein [Sphingorhabdus sp. M41]|uniref:hypothetical protein n=1 Tax=Sphingorhabdus sp. M41 TaxID=1806885 RepID=UPI00078E3F5A|nr:hypothetical protein [Sphingorhabdus sp. M41]AMO72382.1 hypothetical protein AZE99_11425 [Sphingorhabdus sp. M41]
MKNTSKITSYKKLSITTAMAAILALGVVPFGSTHAANAAIQDSHSSGSSDHSDHDSDHGSKGQKGGKGDAAGEKGQGKKGGHDSLEDIFRDVTASSDDGEEDSDKPAWAGGGGGKNDRGEKPSTAGSARGDLYGDMYVILRDDNGVPILSEDGFVQPIDADGNPLPLDEEGAPIDPSLATEVELGRLNVGRAPTQVLDRRAEEVITLLNTATDVSLDAAGRLVLTVDGVAKTIDSPLENLAIYVALMTTGTIPGVEDLPGTEFDHLVDGVLTMEDLVSAAAFAAGATDKTGSFSVDEVAYLNAFLGINIEKTGDVAYSVFDFSEFSYDRSDMYEDITVEVLIKQPDGTYAPTVINVYEVIFNNEDYSGSGSISVFSQAADDARAIINFIHEYEVPADSVN